MSETNNQYLQDTHDIQYASCKLLLTIIRPCPTEDHKCPQLKYIPNRPNMKVNQCRLTLIFLRLIRSTTTGMLLIIRLSRSVFA